MLLRHYWDLLAAYLRPLRASVLLLGALVLAGSVLQLLSPQIVRYFIDITQAQDQSADLSAAALLYLGAALAQRALALGAVYLGAQVGWAATNALRADLTQHLLRLDPGFHNRRTPGELIERVDGDITALAGFFSKLTVTLLGNGLLVLGALALLLREDWRAGLGIGVYVAATLLALGAIQRIAVPHWAAAREASAVQFGFIEERLQGTEDIRANGAAPYVLRRLDALTHTQLVTVRRAQLAGALTTVGTNLLGALGYAAGLALGAWLYTQGRASLGTAFLITAYVGLLSQPLEAIRQQLAELQQATAAILRVRELRDIAPALPERPRAALPAGALGLAFEEVTFAYAGEGPTKDEGRRTKDEGPTADGRQPTTNDQRPTAAGERPTAAGERPTAADERLTAQELSTENLSQCSMLNAQFPALAGVSFALEPGAVLGVLGHTGSGKTTLTRLLFRLYDPRGGAVRLGGHDLRDLALADLRGRVGLVTQDVQLFQASVRDNLTFFDRRIGDAALAGVLGELGLRPWLEALPQGLDTPLLPGGRGLSAGQAQLLACARVFLRDPGLVVLDEASSRLDPATERLLERAFDRLLRGRTGIIIAHRLATVQRADQILILERGRVVEFGPRAALAADPGSRLSRLLRAGMEEVLA
jgi:ABC-type multidrug transport system fused ATPase/permease subunit